MVKVASNEHLLAVSKHSDQFVPVSGAELHQCLHLGHKFLCPFTGVRLTEKYPCCLCAIFLAQTDKILSQCDLVLFEEKGPFGKTKCYHFCVIHNQFHFWCFYVCRRTDSDCFLGLTAVTLEFWMFSLVTFVSTFKPSVNMQEVVSLIPAYFSLFDSEFYAELLMG